MLTKNPRENAPGTQLGAIPQKVSSPAKNDWDEITLQLDVQQALMQLTDTERQLVYARLEGRPAARLALHQGTAQRSPLRLWGAQGE